MNEEKDEFLREIDELLGDVDDEAPLPTHSKVNGSCAEEETRSIDLELANSLGSLTVQSTNSQSRPKTG